MPQVIPLDSTPLHRATDVPLTSKGHPSPRDNSHLTTKIEKNISKCSQCGQVFNSVYAFDKHQSLSGEKVICTHPDDLGMSFNTRGYWITEPRFS